MPAKVRSVGTDVGERPTGRSWAQSCIDTVLHCTVLQYNGKLQNDFSYWLSIYCRLPTVLYHTSLEHEHEHEQVQGGPCSLLIVHRSWSLKRFRRPTWVSPYLQ